MSGAAFVGRGEELRELAEAIASPPALAIVEGEAGIGKTRLVRQLLERPAVDGRHVLIGHCHPLRDPFPLGPVIDALRDVGERSPAAVLTPLTGVLRPLLPELGERLPPIPAGLDPSADHHLLFRAVVEVLGRLGPTVCVLEDLHWADASTRDFLQFLLPQMPAGLSMVVTYRSEEVPDMPGILSLTGRGVPRVAARRVQLGPLPPADVRRLVGAILAADTVSDDFTAYLHERTAGIPFAVEEVVRLFQERQDVVRLDGQWRRKEVRELAVPVAMRDFVLERVLRLAPDARRVVEAAAVIELPSGEDELLGVAGLRGDTGSRAVSEAVAGMLLTEVEPGVIALRHGLARDAVYESIVGSERRRLHRRAARLLEAADPPPLARIAHHYGRAGRGDRWLHYVEAAADAAASGMDSSSSARFLEQALSSGGGSAGDRRRLALKLGRAALRSVVHAPAAVEALRGVLSEGELEPPVRGELRLLLGNLLTLTGEPAAGFDEEVAAVADLAGCPELAVQVMTGLALPWTLEHHLDEHLSWMERAMAIASSQGDHLLRISTLVTRATLLLYIGDHSASGALALYREAADTEQQRGLIWAELGLSAAWFHLGDYRRAEELSAAARRRSEGVGDGPYCDVLDGSDLLLRWATGRWEGLETRARRHAELNSDIPRRSVVGLRIVAGLLVTRGDADEAERWLGRFKEAATRAGLVPPLAAAHAGLARLALERGEPEAACEEAMRGVEVVRRKGVWVWAAEVAPVAVEALIAARRPAEARRLVTDLAAGLQRREAPLAHAALRLCQALLAKPGGRVAGEAFEQAERDYSALPRPYEAAQVAMRRGLALLGTPDGDASAHLQRALTAFEQLGASGDASRVRRVVREHSLPVPFPNRWRGGRKGYGTHLSPREREVAELLARGRSNADIARALFLSPRTIEQHVSGVLTKLGIRSRAGVAARLPAGSGGGERKMGVAGRQR